MVWGQSRASSGSAEVVPSPAVEGDGAPGTVRLVGRCRLCPSWAGPLHMESQLICSQSFVPHISQCRHLDWVNCCEESCTFDVLATEQRCCDSSGSCVVVCVGYLTVMVG